MNLRAYHLPQPDQYRICSNPDCGAMVLDGESCDCQLPCEACGYERCKCDRDDLNIDSTANLGLEGM